MCCAGLRERGGCGNIKRAGAFGIVVNLVGKACGGAYKCVCLVEMKAAGADGTQRTMYNDIWSGDSISLFFIQN